MAKKKVTVVYSCDNAESVACAITVLSYYRKDTVQTIDLYGLTEGQITTALGLLDNAQDCVISAAPDLSNWTGTHQSALEALISVGGDIYEWTEETSTGRLSMARQMWDALSNSSSPSEMIWLLGTPDVDLSDADIIKKTKYQMGILAKVVKLNTGLTGIELNTSDTVLKSSCDAIDEGIWSAVKNSAIDSLMPQPNINSLALYDILMGGEFVYNYTGFMSYLPDGSESSSGSESGGL